jgi:hypothetical protein
MGLIGTNSNQVPTNADLGTMAFEDVENFRGNINIDFTGEITSGIWNANLDDITRPSVKPALNLDFAKSKMLDPRITYARANNATYFAADGLLKIAAPNEPRFDHDPVTGESLGLLIEDSRVNLLPFTDNFDNSIWGKNYGATIVSNATIAPDGTLTADKLVANSAYNYSHTLYIIGGSAITPNTPYTASLFIKPAEFTRYFNLYLDSTVAGATVSADYDILTLTASAGADSKATALSSSIYPVNNGWYRCILTFKSEGSNAWFHPTLKNNSNVAGFTGDDVSGMYIWGAQLEYQQAYGGQFATSYIPSNDAFTSRACTATYVGSNGLLQTAAFNTARYNYNPANLAIPPKLLLENASANQVLYSEQFNSWIQYYCTITQNATIAPDGTLTADKLVESNDNIHHFIYRNRSANNETMTLSVFAKAAERNYIQLQLSNFVAESVQVSFELVGGTVGAPYGLLNTDYTGVSANIVPYGNGWYRCSLTATKHAVNNTNTPAITVMVTPNGASYQGDGTSGVYIWGAQLETGYSTTSYIPTTSSTVSRVADVSTSNSARREADNPIITGTNFSGWYRQGEGTVFSVFDNMATNVAYGWPRVWELTLGNGIYGQTDSFKLVKNNTTNSDFYTTMFNRLTEQEIMGGPTNVASNSKIYYAFGYKYNDIAQSFNGNVVTTDTSAVIPVVDTLCIGNAYNGSNLCGHISKLTYYTKRLVNSELLSLTANT